MPKARIGTPSVADSRAQAIRTAAIVATVLVALRFTPLTSQLPILTIPESFAYDTLFELQRPDPPGDIVIVAIDDPSIARLGRFPWPRRQYARLLDVTRGAKAVAFDVLLSEPDAHDPAGDALFGGAIRRHGRVVLGCFKTAVVTVGQGPAYDLGARAYPSPASAALKPMQAANFVPPIPTFAAGAAGVGYVDIEPDGDGVYRRFAPARRGYDGKVYPHFATEIARVAGGQPPEAVAAGLAPEGTLAPAAGRCLRLDPDGAVLINYCGPMGTVPVYSFAKVVSGETPPEALSGKIIIVGATAPGLYDIRPAPYRTASRMFMGVETNANITNTLLHRDQLHDQTTAWVWGLLAVALGVFVAWVVWSTPEGLGVAIAAAVVALVAVPLFWLAYMLPRAVIPYGAILLATAIPAACESYSRLTRDRKAIREQFGVYVSPAVLDELARHPDLVRQGVHRKVTVLFSDIRGSTTLSEHIAPEVWLQQLNEYLTQMSEAVFEHDGYLDKFMGDGIMAVWNTFGRQEDHAAAAVRAGLRMLRRLDALNAVWREMPDRTPLRIGIGIHTGEAVVGNVGSDERTQFTVIGDAVNTAARIEALTKEHGVAFIITEATAGEAGSVSHLREIGSSEVRGRTGEIRVFEVLGAAGPPREGEC